LINQQVVLKINVKPNEFNTISPIDSDCNKYANDTKTNNDNHIYYGYVYLLLTKQAGPAIEPTLLRLYRAIGCNGFNVLYCVNMLG